MTATDNPLVSVIVPVYNVEAFLTKCLDSILAQDYKNLEIILVNDGSTDSSLKICQKYKAKDSRTIIISQENAGLSAARNTGIDSATGEYLTFIDSDDYVEKNYISILLKLAKEQSCKLSSIKHNVIYPNHIEKAYSNKTYQLSPHDTLKMMLYGDDFDVSAWGKLYHKDLFNGVRFPIGKLFEDSATTYKAILKTNFVSFCSIPLYNYVIRSASITNRNFSDRDFDLIDNTKRMCHDITQKYPDLKAACNRRVMYAYLSTLSKLALSDQPKNRKYLKRLLPCIKSHRRQILKDQNIPKRDRIALLALGLGYPVFRFIWKHYASHRKTGIA